MKIAFLFSGQGSQYEQMGKDLYAYSPVVQSYYDKAKALLGYDVLTLNQAQLNDTTFAQTAIYTLSVSLQQLLKNANVKPQMVAGLSLGEYAALTCADALTFEDGLTLLQKRAHYMAQACDAIPTSMIAVLTEDKTLVQTICQTITNDSDQPLGIYPANFNTKGQIVIGGLKEQLEKATTLLKEKGIKRVVPLNVSGAFHTPYMNSAAQQLLTDLTQTTFQPLTVPVITNVTGQHVDGTQIASTLAQQVVSPVQFEQSIETMLQEGIDTFIELGPKNVLTSFVKKINKEVTTYAIDSVEQLQQVLSQLGVSQ